MDAVALAMIEALPVTAPTVGWQTIGSLSQKSGAATSTDGTRIYSTHGLSAGSLINSTEIVTAAGAYALGPNASVARQGVAGAWCNGKHYAIGGLDGSPSVRNVVEAYTPAGTNGASGVWSTFANLPQPLAYLSAAVIGNFGYVAGGQAGQLASQAVANLYRYDTVNNVWATLASMPAARTQGAMVAVGTKLYYLGGYDSSGTATATTYVFDTVAGTWTTGPAITASAVSVPSVVVGGSIFLIGANGGYYRFDGSSWSNYITSALVPSGHGSNAGAVAIDGSIYLVSGSSTANVDKLDLGAGTGYTSAVLGAKSLLNPILAGVASILPATPPTDTTGKAAYAQTVQTLKALAAL